MFFTIVKYLPALPLVEVETTNLEIPFGYSLVLERRKNGNENRYITMYLNKYFYRDTACVYKYSGMHFFPPEMYYILGY